MKNKEPVITAGPTATATTTVTSIFKEEEKEYIDHPLHESQIGDRSALQYIPGLEKDPNIMYYFTGFSKRIEQ